MKKIISLLLAVLITFSFAACTNNKKNEEDTTAETRIFIDSAGREVEVPTNITAVIPSGRMAQMFVWPLAADKLVSVAVPLSDDQLVYLGSQYKDLPETGDLYKTGSELNIEEVASLNAQIIIDFGEPKDTIAEDLDALQELLGIPCIFIEGSLENSAEAYRMLGDLLNMNEEAEEIAAYIDEIIGTTQQVFTAVEKKDAVVINGSDGLGCVASGTYFDEIWAYMLNNVAVVEDGQMYASTAIDFEQLANWNPEYIFFYPPADASTIIAGNEWQQLAAVKENKCYTAPGTPYNFISPPTINRYLGIVWIAETVYPDDFDWDMKAMVMQYYDLFYHYELSDAEYNTMMGINE